MGVLSVMQAAVLGLVEGVTEYLPISSTGHLIVASSLMGLEDPAHPNVKDAVDSFNVVIQGGAILAVVGLYWPRFAQMLRGALGRDPAGLRLVFNLAAAFLPAAAVGLVLHKTIKAHLFFAAPVAIAFIVGGLYMMAVDQWRRGRFGPPPAPSAEKGIDDLSIPDAVKIGLIQCVAMWPGVSRSMMTITGGFFVGLRPAAAAEFSFLLGVPTLTAAAGLDLYKNLKHSRLTGEPNLFQELGITATMVGVLVAAISAALAVRWLVGFLNRRGLSPFGWYRVAAGVVLLLLVARGMVTIVPDSETSTPRGPIEKSAANPDHPPGADR
ncbi:MAG: undecaprenyl-diphosphate phosphatase [Phycisphaerae bacterium]|nr:undecaprenyl-diphosphate phosphatase [Phycisphaerae bacterium]